jgi:hypothetical protein
MTVRVYTEGQWEALLNANKIIKLFRFPVHSNNVIICAVTACTDGYVGFIAESDTEARTPIMNFMSRWKKYTQECVK